MKLDDLTETPQLITHDQFDHGMDDEEHNHSLYTKVANSNKTKKITDHDKGRDLVSYGDRILLLNHNRQTIDYYVKTVDVKIKRLGQHVVQVEVWRSNDIGVNGIAKKVFFDYLLPRRHVMVTDRMQTPDGKRFWIDVVEKAFNNSMYVYIYDMNTGDLIEVNDSADYATKLKQIYGSTDKFKKVVVAISVNKIS